MNKPLIFPLVIMFIIAVVLFAMLSVTPDVATEDYSNSSGVFIDGANRTVLIPQAEEQTINIWLVGGSLAVIIAATAIGIVAGIKVLGSGISETSQRYIVVGFIYLGLWGCLTVVTISMMFESIITIVIWFSLNIIFVFGLATELVGD